jgi:hypothetical protein
MSQPPESAEFLTLSLVTCNIIVNHPNLMHETPAANLDFPALFIPIEIRSVDAGWADIGRIF